VEQVKVKEVREGGERSEGGENSEGRSDGSEAIEVKEEKAELKKWRK
jgi:hypothetical protein